MGTKLTIREAYPDSELELCPRCRTVRMVPEDFCVIPTEAEWIAPVFGCIRRLQGCEKALIGRKFYARVFACAPQAAHDPSTVGMTEVANR